MSSQREIDSYHGPATISLRDGTWFDVICDYRATQGIVGGSFGANAAATGLTSWTGAFTAPDWFGEAGDGTLQLKDGRSGEIVVTQVRISLGVTTGAFVGNGDPPR